MNKSKQVLKKAFYCSFVILFRIYEHLRIALKDSPIQINAMVKLYGKKSIIKFFKFK